MRGRRDRIRSAAADRPLSCFDLRREAFDGSSERVALLRGAPCRRKEAGGDRQRKEESLHGS